VALLVQNDGSRRIAAIEASSAAASSGHYRRPRWTRLRHFPPFVVLLEADLRALASLQSLERKRLRS
jgi:hypothetical protein